MKLHIKKGDKVRVLSGDYRGKEGMVLRASPKDGTAIVEGINMVKKHTRPSAKNPNGGILEQEAPIRVSKLMLIENGRPTRTGRKPNADGKLERYSKRTGNTV